MRSAVSQKAKLLWSGTVGRTSRRTPAKVWGFRFRAYASRIQRFGFQDLLPLRGHMDGCVQGFFYEVCAVLGILQGNENIQTLQGLGFTLPRDLERVAPTHCMGRNQYDKKRCCFFCPWLLHRLENPVEEPV